MDKQGLMDEVRTLSQDIGSLREAFTEDGENRPEVLRMCAGKARHAGDVLDRLADEVEERIEEVA